MRFDKPIVGDPRVLLKPLEAFIGGVALAPDRTSASFTLKGSYKPRVFTTGLSVVVDLVSDGPTERRAPTTGEVAQVGVRGGEHMGFSRLVFEWPAPVEYSVDKQGDKATISFARRGAINPQGLRAVLPADVTGAEVAASDKRTTVTLRVPPEVRLRHYSGGGRVVVDVVRPVGS
ncbi:MAG: hypothetical protein HQL40_18505, partial [Alphaproteobacteria bacterium]|nr:hypothetical protein [Alphaproteobacteria bacterium]